MNTAIQTAVSGYLTLEDIATARANVFAMQLVGRFDFLDANLRLSALRQRRVEIETEFRSGSTSSNAESVREPYPLTSPQGPTAADLSR